jgi:hypothetical protein
MFIQAQACDSDADVGIFVVDRLSNINQGGVSST